MSELLKAALDYASYGWGVFPCRPKSKMPANSNGCVGAVTDHEQIEKWWSQNPNYNIGLATGYSFWALDIDVKSGGFESLEKLEQTYGKLPDTVTQITGTNGKHLLFQQGRTVVRNGVSHLGDGLDVRGHHGYIMAAPSIHDKTGRMYLWDGIREYRDTIAEAPDWLYSLMADKPAVAVATELDRIPRGQQHNAVLSFIGKQWDWGFTAPEIKAMGREFIKRCEDKFPVDEMERMVDSCSRYERKHAVSEIAKQLARDIVIAQRDVVVERLDVRREIGVYQPREEWRTGLMLKDSNRPEKGYAFDVHNVIQALGYCPEFSGSFVKDVFAQRIQWTRPICGGKIRAGEDLKDEHLTIIQASISSELQISSSDDMVAKAINAIAREFEVHPLQDYLKGLEWDKVARIDTWLTRYLGEPESIYSRELGTAWLKSAVQRAFHPGSKVDICLILEGEQGIKKSMALNILGGEWFTELTTSIDDVKETAMALAGKWIVEIGELSAIKGAKLESVKRFMLATVDTYRPPWGRVAVTIPRCYVFAGTTNEDQYLNDPTGNRRFWMVQCSNVMGSQLPSIDADALLRDRDQLWAETVVRLSEDRKWHIDNEEAILQARDKQSDRVLSDAWEEIIPQVASKHHGEFTINDVFEALLIEPARRDSNGQKRIAAILKRQGFSVTPKKVGGKTVRLWSK